MNTPSPRVEETKPLVLPPMSVPEEPQNLTDQALEQLMLRWIEAQEGDDDITIPQLSPPTSH
jgi:hypothetical protein